MDDGELSTRGSFTSSMGFESLLTQLSSVVHKISAKTAYHSLHGSKKSPVRNGSWWTPPVLSNTRGRQWSNSIAKTQDPIHPKP